MKVFKFGGASVKDASAVRNVKTILDLFKGEKLIVVISAMGKTTNKLEEVVNALWNRNEVEFNQHCEEIRSFHLAIMNDLFDSTDHPIFKEINQQIDELKSFYLQSVPDNYSFEYDQIVSLGEVISTKIVNAFIQGQGLTSTWSDARKLIRTNNTYQEAEIDWTKTEQLIKDHFIPTFDQIDIQITQGFVGHTSEGLTTTLGREGSDFTAGIFAYCSNAESVTIWKDVPGMLNADPKWFDNTIKLEKISFKEAIELSYYGASVIHPKTVKPLQNKNIPLYVKSFIDPHAEGTVIQKDMDCDHLVPSFIFKMDQTLFSFTTKDFSFIVESHLSDIFNRLAKIGAKINLMQNSALSFSILVDHAKVNSSKVLAAFEDDYEVKFNEGLELITIRHHDQETIDRVTTNKEVLLMQKTRQTARLIVKDLNGNS